MDDSTHGVECTYWDNIGGGWRMDCECGFTTEFHSSLEAAGEEMDDHFREVRENEK